MKKIKFISAIALSLVLASCDDFDLPNPPGQTYPDADGYFENSDISIDAINGGTIDLNTLSGENADVNLGMVSNLVNFPAEYKLAVDLQVGSDNNFSKVATQTMTITPDSALTIAPDILNGMIQEVLTKAPCTLNVPARFVAYAERGTTRMRLGGINATFAPTVYSVTTLNPVEVIEDAYYLVTESMDWNVSKAIKMENTSAGVSPYDNPNFAIKVDVPVGSRFKWKIVPQSSYVAGNWDGALGCRPAEDNDLAGKLISTTQGSDDAGVITLGGPVLISVNIADKSYTVNYAIDVLYAGSTLSNASKDFRLFTDNYINYSGVASLNRVWYLAGEPNYRGDLVFKQDADKGFTDEDGIRKGFLTGGEGTNLSAPAKGFYWVDVNLVELTYELSQINSMSVIGVANEWNLGTAVELTPSKDYKTWTAKGVTIGSEFKINCNGAWAISFGGPAETGITGPQVFNVVYNGSNCQATPGVYDVEVNFSARPYTVTLK
ncbi:MAG: hypothetical protein NC204_00115 [Candidatus Amulumruptor caecigallinarius]|nr:hypothetical protein [Candidatus Amulumruptor caecigallinarius]